ncbi:MAG: endolytic transglycosylase MltG [Muribaculaceae bacterium]|nr:endolytic transglycosylase MltG [Muribaculaceae bacterium]
MESINTDNNSSQQIVSPSPQENADASGKTIPDPTPAPENKPLSENTPLSENPPAPEHKHGRHFLHKKAAVLWSVIALIIVAAAIFFIPLFTGEAYADTIIRIPRNATRETVKDSVAKYLGDDFAKKVIKAAKLRGSDFSARHGAYLITEGMSPVKAEHVLSHGAQHPLTVTINGFRGIGTLSQRLARKLDFSDDEFIAQATDPAVTIPYGLTPGQILSIFIDDSYEVYWSASPADLIDKVGSHYNNVWNKERKEKAAALGLTPAQVMTLCSIVDEETNKLDEKGTIGRLYINRLNSGMKLQADPTVRYALGDFTIKRILTKHLSVDSPFNTYQHQGLPPGPIRTTSVATIDAVLDSQPHEFLYMCAKEDFSGYHNFAKTYSEHLENARRYQKALNDRGIK